MSYIVKKRKVYNQPPSATMKAALAVIDNLGGKQSKKSAPEEGHLNANFNKKVGGQSLPNRVQLEITIKEKAAQSMVAIIGYPVDPIGNKLSFGVNGDPARTVIDAFLGDLDQRV